MKWSYVAPNLAILWPRGPHLSSSWIPFRKLLGLSFSPVQGTSTALDHAQLAWVRGQAKRSMVSICWKQPWAPQKGGQKDLDSFKICRNGSIYLGFHWISMDFRYFSAKRFLLRFWQVPRIQNLHKENHPFFRPKTLPISHAFLCFYDLLSLHKFYIKSFKHLSQILFPIFTNYLLSLLSFIIF